MNKEKIHKLIFDSYNSQAVERALANRKIAQLAQEKDLTEIKTTLPASILHINTQGV